LAYQFRLRSADVGSLSLADSLLMPRRGGTGILPVLIEPGDVAVESTIQHGFWSVEAPRRAFFDANPKICIQIRDGNGPHGMATILESQTASGSAGQASSGTRATAGD